MVTHENPILCPPLQDTQNFRAHGNHNIDSCQTHRPLGETCSAALMIPLHSHHLSRLCPSAAQVKLRPGTVGALKTCLRSKSFRKGPARVERNLTIVPVLLVVDHGQVLVALSLGSLVYGGDQS